MLEPSGVLSVAAAESVSLPGSAAVIVVPGGMPAATIRWPTAKGAGPFEDTETPLADLPASTGAEMVTDASPTATIVVPAGMPFPSIRCPVTNFPTLVKSPVSSAEPSTRVAVPLAATSSVTTLEPLVNPPPPRP